MKQTGAFDITFNEIIDHSTINPTAIHIRENNSTGGVTLSISELDITANSDTISFTLNSAHLNLVIALDTPTLYIDAAAVQDISGNNIAGSAFDVTTASYVYTFSVADQDPYPNDLTFSPDGTQMFVVGYNSKNVTAYDLSTAFDVSTASFDNFFSVAAKESSPGSLAFSPNGTKMFVVGLGSGNVNEYTLSTAFDVSTASFDNFFPINNKESSPFGLAFSPNGTKMFVVGSENGNVNEYDLSNAFDVTTASFVDYFSTGGYDLYPAGLVFSPNGTKMFVVGSERDRVYEYTLTTAFDVSTASPDNSFPVDTYETTPFGLAFSPDGTKMFVTGLFSGNVYEYDLSTAFNIDVLIANSMVSNVELLSISDAAILSYYIQLTHPLFLSDDVRVITTKLVQITESLSLSDGIHLIDTTPPEFSSATLREATGAFDITFNEIIDHSTINPTAIYIRENNTSTGGVTLFISELDTTANSDTISFTLNSAHLNLVIALDTPALYIDVSAVQDILGNNFVGSAFNITLIDIPTEFSSATLNRETGAFDITFDGIINHSTINPTAIHIRENNTSTGGVTLSISELDTTANSDTISFTLNSAHLDLVNALNTPALYIDPSAVRDIIGDHFVGSAFDVTTASFGNSFSVNNEEILPYGLTFSPDGTKMFVVGYISKNVTAYDLSTAFDVTTASFVDFFSVATYETNPASLTFSPSGTKMFVTGVNSGNVTAYDLSVAFDVTTASFVDFFSVATYETNPASLAFSPDGTKMFVVGYGNDNVNEYGLSTAFDVTTASFVASFPVDDQESSPRGLAFSPDGTKMFVTGSNSGNVNEYTLSTAFDVSTASYTGNSFSVTGHVIAPFGLAFSTDGTKMFVIGLGNDNVNEYDLSTAFNITLFGNPIVPNVESLSISDTIRIYDPMDLTFGNNVGFDDTTPWIEDLSFQYRRAFTIDADNVPGSSNLADFAVMLSLNAAQGFDTIMQSHMNNDGSDLRFADNLGNLLPYEIEKYDESANQMIVWVKSNSTGISSSIDTGIYMYYGNSAAASAADSASVWNDDYKAVFHFNDNVDDSTINDNDGTNSGSTNTAGLIGNARDFDGISDRIYLPNTSLNFTGGNLTLSLWMNTDTTSGAHVLIGKSVDSNHNDPYYRWLLFQSDDKYSMRLGTTAQNSATTIPVDTWKYYVGAFDTASNEFKLYVDGDLINTTDTDQELVQSSRQPTIGGRDTDNNPNDESYDGQFDEVRISSAVKSAHWIKTEFNNQNSPSTFYDIGDEIKLGTIFDTVTLTDTAIGTKSYNISLTESLSLYDTAHLIVIYPEFSSATLNRETGAFDITFNKIIDYTTINPTAIHIRENNSTGGITLSISELDTIADSDTISFTLNSAHLDLVNALDTPALYIDAAAVQDTSGNNFVGSAFDVTTASYTGNSFSVFSQETDPFGLTFSPDGTKMFVTGMNSGNVTAYDLSVAFDVTTSSFVDFFSVAAQESSPASLAFSPNGTKMFVTGVDNGNVTAYDLSVAFDVTTSSFVDFFSVAAQEFSPAGLAFSPDGTKMFVTGVNNGNVTAYDLSVAFDVTTSSFVDFFSVAAREFSPAGLAFSPDGTKMFVVGFSNANVNEYTLSIPFDVTTSSFVDYFSVNAGASLPGGLDFSLGGTVPPVERGSAIETLTSLTFSPNGTKMFVVGYNHDRVHEYNLSTAFNIVLFGIPKVSSVESLSLSDSAGIMSNNMIPLTESLSISDTIRIQSPMDSTFSNNVGFDDTTPWIEDLSFQYRRAFTIDADNVPGSSNLADFAVMLSLNAAQGFDTIMQSHMNNDGSDLRFADNLGNLLPYEIEKYDESANQMIVWVKSNSTGISSSIDTSIYMYYGNSAATSAADPTSVWNDDYKAVFHFNDNVDDSTINDNDGTNSGSTNTAGLIGNARDFDGMSDRIYLPNTSLNFTGGNLTLSLWMNTDVDSGAHVLIGKSVDSNHNDPYYRWLLYQSDDKYSMRLNTTAQNSATTIPVDTWKYFVGAFDTASNEFKLYVDGDLTDTFTTDQELVQSSRQPTIGGRDTSDNNPNDESYDGQFDEVRISSAVKSVHWIKTEFNNQNSPSTFYNIGDEIKLGTIFDTVTLDDSVVVLSGKTIIKILELLLISDYTSSESVLSGVNTSESTATLPYAQHTSTVESISNVSSSPVSGSPHLEIDIAPLDSSSTSESSTGLTVTITTTRGDTTGLFSDSHGTLAVIKSTTDTSILDTTLVAFGDPGPTLNKIRASDYYAIDDTSGNIVDTTISMSYNDSLITKLGIEESSLVIYKRSDVSESNWIALSEISHDMTNNVIVAENDGFSTYALGGPTSTTPTTPTQINRGGGGGGGGGSSIRGPVFESGQSAVLYEVSWDAINDDSTLLSIIAGPDSDAISIKIRTPESGVLYTHRAESQPYSDGDRVLYEATIPSSNDFVVVYVEAVSQRNVNVAHNMINLYNTSGTVIITEYVHDDSSKDSSDVTPGTIQGQLETIASIDTPRIILDDLLKLLYITEYDGSNAIQYDYLTLQTVPDNYAKVYHNIDNQYTTAVSLINSQTGTMEIVLQVSHTDDKVNSARIVYLGNEVTIKVSAGADEILVDSASMIHDVTVPDGISSDTLYTTMNLKSQIAPNDENSFKRVMSHMSITNENTAEQLKYYTILQQQPKTDNIKSYSVSAMPDRYGDVDGANSDLNLILVLYEDDDDSTVSARIAHMGDDTMIVLSENNDITLPYTQSTEIPLYPNTSKDNMATDDQ